MIVKPTISLNTEKEKVENKLDEKLQVRVRELEKRNQELERELEKALKELADLKREQAEQVESTSVVQKARRATREVQ